MASLFRGTPTIIFLMRKLCKMVRLYGTHGVGTRTSPAVAVALDALAAACMAWEILDNQPAEVDATVDGGWEDQPGNQPVGGGGGGSW